MGSQGRKPRAQPLSGSGEEQLRGLEPCWKASWKPEKDLLPSLCLLALRAHSLSPVLSPTQGNKLAQSRNQTGRQWEPTCTWQEPVEK